MSELPENFVCLKCGMLFYDIPLSHGFAYMGWFRKPKPWKRCNGKIVPIVQRCVGC